MPVTAHDIQKRRRQRHFVRFQGEPPLDAPLPKQVNVSAVVPRVVEGDTIAQLLEEQQKLMAAALKQVNDLTVINAIAAEAAEAAENAGSDSDDDGDAAVQGTQFERQLIYIQQTLESMLEQPHWQPRLDGLREGHAHAFAVKIPRRNNSQMFSERTFAKGEVVLYRPTQEEVVVDSIERWGPRTEYVVRTDSGQLRSVLGERLLRLANQPSDTSDDHKVGAVRIRTAGIEPCFEHASLPLYSMQPVEYPDAFMVNMVLRPRGCGGVLPTGRDVLRLAQGSLYYGGPVVLAIVTQDATAVVALYPGFIKRLAAYCDEIKQRRVEIIAQNADVCARRFADAPSEAVPVYRHLMTPEEEDPARPVAWLAL